MRHHDICVIIASAAVFVDPRHVNGLITGKHQEFQSLLRTGTEGALRTVLPSALQMRVLLDDWIKEAYTFLSSHHARSTLEKNRFAWDMHDRLICIHPFKTGNGRTARLMLNHLRCLMGLTVQVIRDEEANGYYARLEKYRDEVFLPSLVKA